MDSWDRVDKWKLTIVDLLLKIVGQAGFSEPALCQNANSLKAVEVV